MRALALNHNSQRLSAAYAFSKCGEFAFETAFAVAVVNVTNADIMWIGIVYFLRYLPSTLFAPIGGWLADNVAKKSTLVTVEILKCVAAILIFLMFENTQSSVAMITLSSMLWTILDCLYTPTFRAYFPDMIDNVELPSANSGLQIIEDLSSIIGPLIFSFITLALAPNYTFVFASISLTLSTALMLTLRHLPKHVNLPFNLFAIYKDAVHSISHLRKFNTPLFTVVGCTTLCAIFATSIIRFILPAAVMEHFKSEAAVGYILALLALGTVIGSLLYVKLNSVTSARSVVFYWLLYGLFFLLTAAALEFSTWLFVCLLMCVGFIGAFVDIAIITNIQCLSPPQDVGKNFSLYYVTAVFGDAVSGLVAALVFLIVGPTTFIGMTFMLCIAPLSWSLKRDDADKNCL
jgi:MFS family permease